MRVKYEMTVVIETDGPIEDIGRAYVKEWIKSRILMSGDRDPEDPIHDILNVEVSKATKVRTLHDVRVEAGKARAKSLTPERRKEIASRAARSRWEKNK